MNTSLIAIGLAVLVLGFVYFKGRTAGRDGVKAAVGESNAEAAKRIADVTAKSPNSLSAIREQLSDGSGKL